MGWSSHCTEWHANLPTGSWFNHGGMKIDVSVCISVCALCMCARVFIQGEAWFYTPKSIFSIPYYAVGVCLWRTTTSEFLCNVQRVNCQRHSFVHSQSLSLSFFLCLSRTPRPTHGSRIFRLNYYYYYFLLPFFVFLFWFRHFRQNHEIAKMIFFCFVADTQIECFMHEKKILLYFSRELSLQLCDYFVSPIWEFRCVFNSRLKWYQQYVN